MKQNGTQIDAEKTDNKFHREGAMSAKENSAF
jgi:hypothetical protein